MASSCRDLLIMLYRLSVAQSLSLERRLLLDRLMRVDLQCSIVSLSTYACYISSSASILWYYIILTVTQTKHSACCHQLPAPQGKLS